jgi:hypothetical protein
MNADGTGGEQKKTVAVGGSGNGWGRAGTGCGIGQGSQMRPPEGNIEAVIGRGRRMGEYSPHRNGRERVQERVRLDVVWAYSLFTLLLGVRQARTDVCWDQVLYGGKLGSGLRCRGCGPRYLP